MGARIEVKPTGSGRTDNGYVAEPIPPRPADEQSMRDWWRANARELDRRLNEARDPAEMRALITRRKLVRAGMEFEAALAAYERANPVPATLPDSFPFVVR